MGEVSFFNALDKGFKGHLLLDVRLAPHRDINKSQLVCVCRNKMRDSPKRRKEAGVVVARTFQPATPKVQQPWQLTHSLDSFAAVEIVRHVERPEMWHLFCRACQASG